MDTNKDDNSLDEQANHIFNQRPKMGSFKKAVALGTCFLSGISGSGCIGDDIAVLTKVSPNPQEVSDYQETKLKASKDKFGTYNGESQEMTYDIVRIVGLAEPMVEKADNKVGYANLMGYTLNDLCDTLRALSVAKEQTSDSQEDSIKEAYQRSESLEGELREAIVRYSRIQRSNRDKSDTERCGYFLVGETLFYGTDNGEYEKTRRKRIDTFGEDLVGNNESYAWIGQTMPEELGRANSHRKNKKTIWTIIGSALGIGIISALGNQNGGGSPDVGGESGSPTGR